LVVATPERAFDAFITRFRSTVGCVAEAGAFGDGREVGGVQSVVLTPRGFEAGDPAPLRSRSGQRDLQLRVAFQYTIVAVPGDREERYRVTPLAYWYGILDGEGREILLFHWHPAGVSNVLTPHLHIPGAASVALGTRSGKGNGKRSVHLGRMHVPTGYVSLEDVVELLIVEFEVQPRHPDWLAVITANRAASESIRAR